jgi:transposase-like protein
MVLVLTPKRCDKVMFQALEYLHNDVTYLPNLAGKKQYLFVAIDRATRVLYFEIYENKTAINAVEFLNNCNLACRQQY